MAGSGRLRVGLTFYVQITAGVWLRSVNSVTLGAPDSAVVVPPAATGMSAHHPAQHYAGLSTGSVKIWPLISRICFTLCPHACLHNYQGSLEYQAIN